MKNEFKNQLTTALLSSPIVYISHFHYQLIDETLQDVLCPKPGDHSIFGDDAIKNVFEFDSGRNCVVNFSDKGINHNMSDYDDLQELIKGLIEKDFARAPILLIKSFSVLEDVTTQSLLAVFAQMYEKDEYDKSTTIIIVSPQSVMSLPREIEKYITVIDIEAPNQTEIMDLLNDYHVTSHPLDDQADSKKELCRTLQGLQYYEIKQIINSVLARTGNIISDTTVRLALKEKKNIVRKLGIIEVVDTDETFEQIGGLDVLKEDLERKAAIYHNLNEAKKNKVPLPKGVLIIGMPGCGKTMIAKSIAKKFRVSLLRLDLNRLMGKYVGESEANLRLALATAEAAHPCVLWIDEIEKVFAGVNNGYNSDLLVMRLMGHFLTWMQERTTPVFIVATANDVMRSEFMRKGRFDEVYFVDFPTKEEQKEILMNVLEPYKGGKTIFDLSQIKDEDYDEIISYMKGHYGGFSGAEIRGVVNMVLEEMFMKYKDGRIQHQWEKVPVKKEDFIRITEWMKPTVMANQKSDDYSCYMNNKKRKGKIMQKNESEWTNIERIYAMQSKYNFKLASK